MPKLSECNTTNCYRYVKNGKKKSLNTRKKRRSVPWISHLSKVVQDQARIKNNPNVPATNKRTSATPTPPNRREKEKSKRVLKTNAQPPAIQPDPSPKKEGEKAKLYPFHDLNGHTLEECLAFRAKSLDERTEWLLAAGLCYRCPSKGHTVSDCEENIECSVCKAKSHPALHRERTRPPPHPKWRSH